MRRLRIAFLLALLVTPILVPAAVSADDVGEAMEEFATPVAQVLSVPDVIDQAARRYGLSPARLRALAMCESTWRPWVTSPYGDAGLFQFQPATFEAARQIADLPPTASRYDPWDASVAAAAYIAAGHAREWPVCARRAGLA